MAQILIGFVQGVIGVIFATVLACAVSYGVSFGWYAGKKNALEED